MFRLSLPTILAAVLLPFAAGAWERSLCERAGGPAVIAMIMTDFGKMMQADKPEKLGRFWIERTETAIARERALAAAFFQQATGCNNSYNGRTMQASHAALALSAGDWDRGMNMFRRAVWTHVADEETRIDLIALASKTRGAIVACESRGHGCEGHQ